MFRIGGSRLLSQRPMRLFGIAAVPAAVALVVTGCGGSSGAQTASHTASSNMGNMGSSGARRTVPAAAHAELTLAASHYGRAIFDGQIAWCTSSQPIARRRAPATARA